MIDAFVEFLDSIYYEGYAMHTALDDPGRFTFEFNEFIENYGSGLKRS
jgi:hypothetical protein